MSRTFHSAATGRIIEIPRFDPIEVSYNGQPVYLTDSLIETLVQATDNAGLTSVFKQFDKRIHLAEVWIRRRDNEPMLFLTVCIDWNDNDAEFIFKTVFDAYLPNTSRYVQWEFT